jgi:hypothetical protein
MASEPVASKLKKAKYYSSVTLLYFVTLLFALLVFEPFPLFGQKTVSAITPVTISDTTALKSLTAGKPVKIIIPGVAIDLPIDEGIYNESDATWTLSGYHAQFAMLSNYANDTEGNTFIYGHNNKFVFGPIKAIHPNDTALLYTDNGHVFSYSFIETRATIPEDTSVLNYEGPPILTIQTCSGSWNEKRQMYTFKFSEVLR